jgi:hypothetical protein
MIDRKNAVEAEFADLPARRTRSRRRRVRPQRRSFLRRNAGHFVSWISAAYVIEVVLLGLVGGVEALADVQNHASIVALAVSFSAIAWMPN